MAGFSPEVEKLNKELKHFLHANMYNHYRVIRMEEKARRIIHELFLTYIDRPEQLPKAFAERMKKDSTPRIVCDYIAGMTDNYAISVYEHLYMPSPCPTDSFTASRLIWVIVSSSELLPT